MWSRGPWMNPVGMRTGPVGGIIPYIGGTPCAGAGTGERPFGVASFDGAVGVA